MVALAPGVGVAVARWLGLTAGADVRGDVRDAAVEPEPPSAGGRRRSGAAIAIAGVAIVGILAAGWLIIDPQRQAAAIQRRLPVAAVAAFEAGGCTARLLPSYGWAGYVIWSTGRQVGAYGNSSGGPGHRAGAAGSRRSWILAPWLDDHGVGAVLMPADGPLSHWLDEADGMAPRIRGRPGDRPCSGGRRRTVRSARAAPSDSRRIAPAASRHPRRQDRDQRGSTREPQARAGPAMTATTRSGSPWRRRPMIPAAIANRQSCHGTDRQRHGDERRLLPMWSAREHEVEVGAPRDPESRTTLTREHRHADRGGERVAPRRAARGRACPRPAMILMAAPTANEPTAMAQAEHDEQGHEEVDVRGSQNSSGHRRERDQRERAQDIAGPPARTGAEPNSTVQPAMNSQAGTTASTRSERLGERRRVEVGERRE